MKKNLAFVTEKSEKRNKVYSYAGLSFNFAQHKIDKFGNGSNVNDFSLVTVTAGLTRVG